VRPIDQTPTEPAPVVPDAPQPPVASEPIAPNYWIYLMHDPEVDDRKRPAPGAGLAFYGQRTRRRK
jgi:hypothetical protein